MTTGRNLSRPKQSLKQSKLIPQISLQWSVRPKETSASKKNTTAIDKDPTNHIFYSNRSAAYLQNNNFDAAVRDGMKTSSLKPDWAKGYNRSGCALHALGEYKKAITVLTVGLDTCFLGPDRCWMIDNPAAKLLLDPLKKAKECLQSDEMDAACLEQYDHSASTYHDLGLLYFHGHGGQKKNMKKSIKYLTIAAETYSLPQAFGQLGIMYQENENFLPVAERSNEKSLDLYTRGVALDDPVSLFNLGMLYAQGSCGVVVSSNRSTKHASFGLMLLTKGMSIQHHIHRRLLRWND